MSCFRRGLYRVAVLTNDRATQIVTAFKTCPNTKLIASGYSQGGQLVHNALATLPAATAAWISKVVIFGDPSMFLPTHPTLAREEPMRDIELTKFR